MDFLFKVKYFVFAGPRGRISALREDAISTSGRFKSPADLKGSIALQDTFKEVTAAVRRRDEEEQQEDETFPLEPDVVGFYQPGHQFKGKKHALNTNDDLAQMYELHPQSRKRAVQTTIHLYAEVRRTNHPASQSGDCGRHAGPSKTSASAALMQEKKEFYERIKEKHGASGYSDEQLHMWAYLVATKRHDSEEYPPAKRFFGREGKGKKSSQEKASSSEEVDANAASGSSFATCTSQRDTIVRQIRELVNLRNIGGLTEEEFSAERAKLSKALAACST